MVRQVIGKSALGLMSTVLPAILAEPAAPIHTTTITYKRPLLFCVFQLLFKVIFGCILSVLVTYC